VRIILQRKIGDITAQPVSASQRLCVDSMVALAVLAKTKSMKTAIEASEYVRRPDIVVGHLKRLRALPKDCFVEPAPISGGSETRCALFGVDFQDLAKRLPGIRLCVDDAAAADLVRSYGISPLDGDETVRMIVAMVGHAHVIEPSLCNTDPVVLLLCQLFGQEAVQKALRAGNVNGLVDLVLAPAETLAA